jgi:hypothetical protein
MKLTTPDGSAVLFPSAVALFYGYDIYYIPAEILENVEGYWQSLMAIKALQLQEAM